MKRISFDYDGTLDSNKVMQYASELIKRGYDVHIVTSRPDGFSLPVKEKAMSIGIPNSNIHTLNFYPKEKYFSVKKFDLHFDNNLDTVNLINAAVPSMLAIWVSYWGWKEEAENFLNNVNVGGPVV